MAYSLGDAVEWTSQSHGVSKVKRGMIVEIVPAGNRPDAYAFARLRRRSGASRREVSYVVRTWNPGSAVYWPRQWSLRRVRPGLDRLSPLS